MVKKLFVGGLSYKTTENALGEVFAKAGHVEVVRIVLDRITGQSRGFGFVEMGSPDEADRAVCELNGASVDGRSITVSPAREKSIGSGASMGHRPSY